MKYKIVSASDLSDLEAQVNAWIVGGWVPLGGVAINEETVQWQNERKGGTEQTENCHYLQAMTKDKTE